MAQKIATAKLALERGLSLQLISELTGLALENIQALEKEIEHQ